MNTNRRIFLPFILASIVTFISLRINAQTYDIEITFKSMKCFKVVEAPFDTQEDLFGRIGIIFWKMKNSSNKIEIKGEGISGANDRSYYHTFFTKELDFPFRIGLNETKSFNTYKTVSNLTYDQLMSVEFGLGGFLMDEELKTYVTSIRYRPCQECGTDTHRLIRLSQFKSQIDAMTGPSEKLLTLDSGNNLHINYYEGDSNSSHIRFIFQIKIIRR